MSGTDARAVLSEHAVDEIGDAGHGGFLRAVRCGGSSHGSGDGRRCGAERGCGKCCGCGVKPIGDEGRDQVGEEGGLGDALGFFSEELVLVDWGGDGAREGEGAGKLAVLKRIGRFIVTAGAQQTGAPVKPAHFLPRQFFRRRSEVRARAGAIQDEPLDLRARDWFKIFPGRGGEDYFFDGGEARFAGGGGAAGCSTKSKERSR